METFTMDGEDCGIFDEEVKKRFWSGKKRLKFLVKRKKPENTMT